MRISIQEIEKKFLYYERKNFFVSRKFQKLNKLEKKKIILFCDYLYKNKTFNRDWRYVNFLLKFQKVLKKSYYSYKELENIYND